MLVYVSRRFIGLVFVVFSITLLTFVVAHAAPGDPVQVIMGQRHDPALYRRLQHFYGLDRPGYAQFFSYVWQVLHGDFGYSYHYQSSTVLDLMIRGVPVTLQLGVPALVISVILGVPVGILAAVRRGSLLDSLSMTGVLILYSVPTFVIIPLLLLLDIWAYNHKLPYLPVEGWGNVQDAIMPVAVLAAPNIAYIARLTRTSLLDTLREDYVRTARAKGLSGPMVVLKHALRTALLPIITYIAPAVALLVTSTFIVENLFNIPGIGYASVQALDERDYPVIQGFVIVIAVAVVVMNFVGDIAYRALDPRIGEVA